MHPYSAKIRQPEKASSSNLGRATVGAFSTINHGEKRWDKMFGRSDLNGGGIYLVSLSLHSSSSSIFMLPIVATCHREKGTGQKSMIYLRPNHSGGCTQMAHIARD